MKGHVHSLRQRICVLAIGGVIAVAVLQAPRAGNAATYVVVGGLFLASVVVGAALTRRRRLWAAWAAAALPLAAFPLRGSPETGLLPYANATGALALLACAAAIVGAQYTAGRTRALALVWAATVGALAWLYAAQTAAAGIVAVALVGAFARRRHLSRPLAGAVLAGVVLTVGLTVWLGATYTEDGRTGLAVRAADATLGQLRQQAWADALELIRSEPVRGVGPGRYADVAPSASRHADARWAHSMYLHVAAELGLPAAALVALAAGALLWPPGPEFPGASSVPIVALGALAINAAIDYVMHFPEVLMAAGLLAGAVSGGAGANGSRMADADAFVASRWARPVGAALGAWLLLAAPIPFLNPPFRQATDVRLGLEGATFAGTGTLQTSTFPVEVYRRLRSGKGITIEGWFAPATVDQAGPARLISSSTGIDHRNFTLGQQGDALVVRLRTTDTDWNGTDHELVVPDVFGAGRLRHIAVAYDGAAFRVHVDGETVRQTTGPGGTFDNWVFTYPLAVGNETSGDRPWRGRVVRFALYDEALSSSAIRELAGGVGRPGGHAAISEVAEGLVVAYDLRAATGPIAATGAEAPLVRPQAVPSDPTSFVANLLTWEGQTPVFLPMLARSVVVAVTFAALGRIVVRRVAPPLTGMGSALIPAFACLIAGTALFARHVGGGDISVLALLSAAGGAAIGARRWRQDCRAGRADP